MKTASIPDHEKYEPISAEKLTNINDNLTKAIISIYQNDSFVHRETNEALRNGDLSLVEYLGPFAFLFGKILEIA